MKTLKFYRFQDDWSCPYKVKSPMGRIITATSTYCDECKYHEKDWKSGNHYYIACSGDMQHNRNGANTGDKK